MRGQRRVGPCDACLLIGINRAAVELRIRAGKERECVIVCVRKIEERKQRICSRASVRLTRTGIVNQFPMHTTQ